MFGYSNLLIISASIVKDGTDYWFRLVSRKPNTNFELVWNLRFFIAVKIPYFCPLCLCFSNRLATDHWLREVHLRVAAAIPLCQLHLVYRFQSPPCFPPHVPSSCIPRSLQPPGQGRCTISGQRTSCHCGNSGEAKGRLVSAVWPRRHASVLSYTDLPLCQSPTHVPSLLSMRTLICDFDTLWNKKANAICSAFHMRVTLWACNPVRDEVTQNGQ
jgi:hypothetical protein